MASSAFILSFVYYTFILALVEASRAVLAPTPISIITNSVHITELLASSAVAALALISFIFVVYAALRELDCYADEYATVLSGLIQRVPSRVIPTVTLAASIVLYDIYSSSEPPLGRILHLLASTFSTPTLLYFVAFGVAVAHRMSSVLNVFQDLEHGLGREKDSEEVIMLLSDWERLLFAENKVSQYNHCAAVVWLTKNCRDE